MPLILSSNSISAVGEFKVDNSLRFDDGSSDHLSRTPASASNRKTWTWSGWVKLGNFTEGNIFGAGTDSAPGGDEIRIKYESSGERFYIQGDNTSGLVLAPTAKHRDPSAWYHVVYAHDTTQATASNRAKLYINGELVTALDSATYPAQNREYGVNSTDEHKIGERPRDATDYFDGYMAEVCFIDGQALDPTSFGEFDEDSGIWKPIDVSGLTFGTNGFYLDFENSGSLGADVSGNGNNFTVNNLTSIDQTTDTPTNNWCTLNAAGDALDLEYSNGNLTLKNINGSDGHRRSLATFGVSQSKWYWESKCTANITGFNSGINNGEGLVGNYIGQKENDVGYNFTGVIYKNGTIVASGFTTISLNDIVMYALDLDNNYIYFGVNGTWINSGNPTSGASGTGGFSVNSGHTYHPALSLFTSNSIANVNFGNPMETISSGNSDGNGYGNFEYAVPSGYYALNTKNLAEYG